MKLHLPKSLLTAVLAVGVALPMVYAEDATGIGNSYDKTYTYAGTVYTFAGDSPSNGTVTQYVKVTTRNDAENPTAWTEGEQQATATSNYWASLYANENTAYNTLRITENKDYFFDFAPLTIGGVIVESGTEDASFYSTNANSDRSIVIGKNGLTANSYFGDSFTFDNLRGNNSTRFDVNGTQTWYIANGESVTIQTKKAISNDDEWTISGNGTLSINQSITNNGSLTLTEGASLHVSNINNLAKRYDASTDHITTNGLTTVGTNLVVVNGGTSNVSSITYTSGDSIVTKELTNNSYFAGEASDAYGVATDTTISDIKAEVPGIIIIKEGATLSKNGGSFDAMQELTGQGTYALGEVAKGGANAVLSGNVSLDESWTGTVSLSGGVYNVTPSDNSDSVQNINFNALGNANSTVEIASQGLYGYLNGPGGQTFTFNPNILLTGDLTIQNGNGNAAHIFAGKISGEGNINIIRTGGDNNTHTFKNDISGWEGALNHGTALTTNIKLEGNATEVNAAINRTNGYLNLTVDNANTTTFNKDVTVSKLTATDTALGAGVKVTLTGANDNTASSISSLAADDAGNTIELKEGATLNHIASKSGGAVTLTGAGSYNVSGGTNTALNVTLGSDWTGTVKLTDMTMSNLVLSTYANDNKSSIMFDGVSGYSKMGQNTYGFNMILADNKDALIFNNGGGGDGHIFTGKVSGSGNIVRQTDRGSHQYYKFTGDVSEWTGAFIGKNTAAAQETTIRFTDDATTVAASVKQTGAATTNVIVANGEDVSMTGELTATAGKLTITKKRAEGGANGAESGEASNLTIATVSANGGNVELNTTEGNTMAVTNLSVKSGNTVTGDAALTVTNLTLGSTNSINLTGSLALADGATINLTGLTLTEGTTTYTLATAANGVSLQNYTLTGLDLSGTAFADYTATITAVNPNAAAGVMTLAEGTTTNTALVLTLTAPNTPETLTEITITGGTYANNVLTFTTTADLTNTVFGDTLKATMSEDVWAGIVGANTLPDEVLVSFTDAAGELIDFDGDGTATAPTITINGEGTKGAQVLEGDGTIVGGYVTSYIPEPTTTTLSLLALAGLAVRRRRASR